IPCGLTYGVFCLIKGPMHERVRRCAELFVAGLLIIGLGKAQDLKAPEWWGPIVTYDEAATMQAWRRGGRFEEVPHKPFERLLRGNMERAHKKLGQTFAPDAAVHYVKEHPQATLLGIPAALALLCMAGGFFGRRRRARAIGNSEGITADEEKRGESPRFPWEHIWLFAAAMAAYWLVRFASFKLFLPSRQL